MLSVIRGADGTIYASDFDGVVYALNANGTQKWKLAAAIPYGHGLSLSGTTLYVGTTHSVVALQATDGAPIWEKELGEQVWSLAIAKDGFVFANTVTSVTKLDPNASGNVVWSTPIGQVTGGIAIASDGTIYASIYDGPVKVVAVGPNGTVKWSKAALSSDAVSAPSVGPDGSIYICGTFPDPSVVSLEPVAGNKRWTYKQNENCKAAPMISERRQGLHDEREVAARHLGGERDLALDAGKRHVEPERLAELPLEGQHRRGQLRRRPRRPGRWRPRDERLAARRLRRLRVVEGEVNVPSTTQLWHFPSPPGAGSHSVPGLQTLPAQQTWPAAPHVVLVHSQPFLLDMSQSR